MIKSFDRIILYVPTFVYAKRKNIYILLYFNYWLIIWYKYYQTL